MGLVCMGERILGRKKSFGSRSVTLALRVLFEGVRDGDRSVAEVLAVHRFDGGVRGFEAGEVDEGKTLRIASIWVALNLEHNV
jgi:hypothetical protein